MRKSNDSVPFFSIVARYCDDQDQAEVFYHHALVLVPSNGMNA